MNREYNMLDETRKSVCYVPEAPTMPYGTFRVDRLPSLDEIERELSPIEEELLDIPDEE